jgi:hypothetical protein
MIVKAMKIADIVKDSIFNRTQTLIVPVCATEPVVYVGKAWNERCGATDADKGYFIEYRDGFRSWSPTKAFEEDYVLMEDEDHDEAG